MLTITTQRLTDRTLHWAKAIQTWNIAWETGIYPGEMAAFLGLCDVAGAESIVESGRGLHAYSTQVLGEYAARTGARVVSIDMESDPVRGAETRRMLQRYRQVECAVGDAFDVMPRATARLPGPIAMLLDGPKGRAANRLSLIANTQCSLVAVAHHNSEVGMTWTAEFAAYFPNAYHLEQLPLESADWSAFKSWERDNVHGYELPGPPGRSLTSSSLVLASIPAGYRPTNAVSSLGSYTERVSALRAIRKWQRIAAAAMREPR